MARGLRPRRALAAVVLGLSILALTACTAPLPLEPTMTSTDYATEANWLARPAATHPVATFYLSPTSHFGETPVAAADDPAMRDQAQQVFAVQGAAFASTDVYAPYYRQLGLGYLTSMLGDPARLEAELARVPLADAIAAFQRFLADDAGDRPLVLAAHSQGALVMQGLLGWIAAEHPELRARLVAVYLIGVPLQAEFLARVGIPFATGATDTGVAVAWSTESPAATSNPFVSIPPSLVINPITWTRDETPASAEQSLGGLVRFEFGEPATPAPHFASARLNLARGTVVTDAPIEARDPWPTGVLHRWDIDLFFADLEQNVRDRIAHFRG